MKIDPAWYVVQVLTGTEELTAAKLSDAGMEALAPAQVIYERRHGSWWPVRRIVFPGYVFVRVGMSPRIYHYIKSLPHVIRLLGTNGPEVVPDQQMEIVQVFANGGRDFGVSEGEKSGDKTVITSGPLVQLEARIAKVNPRARRATVEVPILDTTYQVDAGLVLNEIATKATKATK